MHTDFDDELEGVEYPPSERDFPKTFYAGQTTSSKPSTIMKPTISQANKIVKPPQKPLKENQSKPSNSLQIKKETIPQEVHISLKNYVKNSPQQATKTFSHINPIHPTNLYSQNKSVQSSLAQSKQYMSHTLSNQNRPFSASQFLSNDPNNMPMNPSISPLDHNFSISGDQSSQDYKGLYMAYQQQVQKTQKLEESLRNETINSEEQRSYIEILKQALEEKVMGNELLTVDRDKIGNQRKVDIYIELIRANQQLDAKEKELEEIIKRVEEEKEEIQQLIENNKEMVAEHNRLNDEKDSLLEYLNELKENHGRLEQKNQQYETLISSLKNERDQLKPYVGENARLVEELQSEKALAIEIESHRQKLLRRNEELEEKSNESKFYQKEVTNLEKKIECLEKEKLNLNERLANVNENFHTVKCTLQETQGDLDRANEKIRTFGDIKAQKDEFELKYEESEIKNLALREQIEAIQTLKKEEISRIDNDRQRKSEEIRNLYQQLSQNRNETRMLKEEISNLSQEKNALEGEIDSLSRKFDQIKSANMNLESEVGEYRKILQERDISSAKLHTLTIKYQADKDFYEDSMRNMKQKNQELMSENESLAKQVRERGNQGLNENALKYVNSMIVDLKRHLGNTKYNKKNEKFDLESSLLELHELIVMCLDNLEETNATYYSKHQILEEKENEILLLKERIDSLEEEKQIMRLQFEEDQKNLVNEIKESEESRQKIFESESKFEREQLRELIDRLKKEKNCLEYIIKKLRNLISEEKLRKCLDELVSVNYEILQQEIKKTELQIKLEQVSQQSVRSSFYDINNLKDNLHESQICLEKLYDQKKQLEDELGKMELVEKKKSVDKKMLKNNSESNLRQVFEESRVTETSMISNRNYESKLSSIKDEKNRIAVYRDFSTSKYKQEKVDIGRKNGLESEIMPIYSNLNDLRVKLSKKPWRNNYFDDKV